MQKEEKLSDHKAVMSKRLTQVRLWYEREKKLELEQERVRKSWKEINLRYARSLIRLLAGWQRKAAFKLLRQLSLLVVFNYGKVTLVVFPSDYYSFGFDGSPDNCRVWRSVYDIRRDFENLEVTFKDWFTFEFEETYVHGYRNRKDPCLRVRIKPVTE